MEHEIIKQAFKLGNSAGVLLPVDWKNKKVLIKLIDKSISQEIFEILDEENLLKSTIGIFLAGSYARGEETESSDIDILIVTDTIDRQIKRGKYEVIFISKSKFEKSLISNLYIISLINEAKAILNDDFLKQNKNKIGKISTKKHLGEIKSITKINEKSIEIDEEMGQNVSDETLYSIVLRLREVYLIECLKYGKNPAMKKFINLIKKISGEESYNAYIKMGGKDDKRVRKFLRAVMAKRLHGH